MSATTYKTIIIASAIALIAYMVINNEEHEKYAPKSVSYTLEGKVYESCLFFPNDADTTWVNQPVDQTICFTEQTATLFGSTWTQVEPYFFVEDGEVRYF